MSNLYQGRQTWIEPLPDGFATEKFEVAARALIVHEDKVLLVYEAEDDTWSTPGGRLTPGESLREALRREIKEETDLTATTGDLVACFDVLMPRKDHISHKFEFIFRATPTSAPDFIERDHVDGDQSGVHVTKIRWFTADEVKALPNVFPEFLRDWPSLLNPASTPPYRGMSYYAGENDEDVLSADFPVNKFRISTRVIVQEDNKVLLVRNKGGDYWYLAGGGIELGEGLINAAEREIVEETGLTNKVTTHGVVAVDEFANQRFGVHQINLYIASELSCTANFLAAQEGDQVGETVFFTQESLQQEKRVYPSFLAELVWPVKRGLTCQL